MCAKALNQCECECIIITNNVFLDKLAKLCVYFMSIHILCFFLAEMVKQTVLPNQKLPLPWQTTFQQLWVHPLPKK